jgi:hypothetical protein
LAAMLAGFLFIFFLICAAKLGGVFEAEAAKLGGVCNSAQMFVQMVKRKLI